MLKPFLLLITFLVSLSNSLKPVKTKYGYLEGITLKKYRNSVVGYLGVPFAQPPIGKLRFKAPQELNKNAYGKNFKATKLANTCYYRPKYTGFIGFDYWHPKFLNYSEDCLQLNMWVPKKPKGGVLVFLFGRGYHSGTPSLDLYNGAVIAARTRTIVVNINYRLGILGFASLGNGKVISGNMGLLDQQAALKWVYENVEYFGGDPKMITLFGEGTGASSSTAHMFSEKSAKYIRRIIANSGTIKNTWAMQPRRIVEENLQQLAKNLKCEGNDKQILKCLQSKDHKVLVAATDKIIHPEQSPLVHSFTLVDEDDVFFEGNVREKIRNRQMKKKFDVLIGKTSHEATYFMPQFLDMDHFNCKFDPRKPPNSKVNACNMNKTNFENAVKLLCEEYLIDNDDEKTILKKYSNLKDMCYRDKTARFLSDFTFDCDIVQYAKYIAQFVKGNKYFYEYKVRSSSNPWPDWMGSMHSYELEFQFGVPFRHSHRYNKKTFYKERNFSGKMVKMIGDFVNKGNPMPNIKWKQFDDSKVPALIIDANFDKYKTIRFKNAITDTCVLHDYILNKYTHWGIKFKNSRLRQHH
uniref:Acetylcholinesterase n=1 Tax=Parastrongyloides trichosuri TaxID=131310 RepID=A0A0N4Z9S8_PARTI